MLRIHRALIALTGLLALAACSNETSGGAIIVAAEGGTVTTSAVDVSIPAASLAEDTEISIVTSSSSEELPELEGLRLLVELEPRGTVLETPASVVIRASEIGAGEGESVAVYQLLDGWLPVEHSERSGGDLEVPVTRFEPIGVVVREAPSGGAIDGTIAWGDGMPVDGAPIELWMGDTMVSTTSSDANGAFSFADLESGSYSLRVDYECQIDQGVSVVEGDTASVMLTLCGSGGDAMP